jgi:hypothetical protein
VVELDEVDGIDKAGLPLRLDDATLEEPHPPRMGRRIAAIVNASLLHPTPT